MSMNRLNRDQILIRALDLADSATLDAKDRPAGVIVSTAFTIGWLQEALDLFTKKFPWSADIISTPITFSNGAITLTLPADFVLDYNNGVILTDGNAQFRVLKRGLGKLLSVPTLDTNRGRPSLYSILGSTLEFRPKADKDYSATLYYYKLPAALAATDVPIFPDDFILVNYVWLKTQEWHRQIPAGTALKYADDRIVELQRSGIGQEAEEDSLGIDPHFARESQTGLNDWMGIVGK